MVIIVDYESGNLRSVYLKFKRIGVDCMVSSRADEIETADKIVLPGVGHFKHGIKNLQKYGLVDVLNKKVLEDKTPILGLCLGMHLFCNYSEEGECNGLQWIDAEVKKFNVSDDLKYKIPHMGWNSVRIKKSNSLDFDILEDDQFYFDHKYHVICNNPDDIWMTSLYDYEFVSAVKHRNIYCIQFHPEKSHEIGMNILRKFAEL